MNPESSAPNSSLPRLAARLLTTLSLLLAMPMASLYLASYAHPHQLVGFVPPSQPRDALNIVLLRGGLWIRHTRTRPADPSAILPPTVRAGSQPWDLASTDGPQGVDQLKLDQVGPIRLGFAHHLRTSQSSAPALDPRTSKLQFVPGVTEERTVRIPLLAPLFLTLAWPVAQLLGAGYRRTRRRLPGTALPSPSLARLAATLLFDLAALISTLLLTLFLWQAIATTRHEFRASVQVSLPSSRAGVFPPDGGAFGASLFILRDGWELSRGYSSNFQHRLPDHPLYQMFFQRERTGAITYTALTYYDPRDITRVLGFAFARQDVPPAPPAPPSSTRPRATATGTPRRTGQCLLIPHYVLCLAAAVLPAAWLARERSLRRRARRIAAGLCPRCGYDLRATPDRCPECGATPIHTPGSER